MTRYRVEFPREDGTWFLGHHGVELKDPAAYAQKTGARYVEVDDCPICAEVHPAPFDGTCLLG